MRIIKLEKSKTPETTRPALGPSSWTKLKATIILRHGTLENAARELRCSVNGLRMAIVGRCPGILLKLIEDGLVKIDGPLSDTQEVMAERKIKFTPAPFRARISNPAPDSK